MKVKMKILIGIGVIVFTILSYNLLVTRVRVSGRSMNYVEDYQDYYFKSKFFLNRWNFGQSPSTVMKVYFLPGQRSRMCAKIKEDVISELETLVTEHSDIFYKYEIREDFKQVRIYETLNARDAIHWGRRRDLGNKLRVGALIGLYHNIKEGCSVSIDHTQGEGVDFVEHHD